jgi:hypothetical protein
MAVSICAFNSLELTDKELIDDGLNVFVKEKLSNTFSDLLVSKELAINNELNQPGELDQIALLLKVDIEPIYKMSNYWDKEEEIKHLSRYPNEVERAKQSKIIQENNNNLIGNIEKVYKTILAIEKGIVQTADLKFLIKKINPDFYDDNRYFSKASGWSLLNDVLEIRQFIEFVKSVDADTVYFKFSPSTTSNI